MKMQKIIFIGLGTMGYHMAGHLSKNTAIKNGDFELSVFNRTIAKSQKWQNEFGNKNDGKIVNSLKNEIYNFDIIILCAGRDEDMDEIFFDENIGIAKNIKSGAIVIDHTTISYEMASKLSDEISKQNAVFIDAPVSGGEIGAQNGVLSIMAGGCENSLNSVKHLLDSYAKSITFMGRVGSGQLAKMANQICITGVLQGLSEAITFAKQNNLDIDKLLSAISGGAAGSWQMENRGKTMFNEEFDFGFAIKWMIKDLSYALKSAEKSDLNLTLTKEVYEKYQQLAKNGCENFDTSALILHK
jgi:3-hydroxyisobutyrate dehydrogenase